MTIYQVKEIPKDVYLSFNDKNKNGTTTICLSIRRRS